MELPQQTTIQAKIFDFALEELICNHRQTFKPLWKLDSWVKFLIWMSLNTGLSGDRESLEKFVNALGAPLTSRMRRLFFKRTLDQFGLQIIADPSEEKVLLMSIPEGVEISSNIATEALVEVELNLRVLLDKSTWEFHDGVIFIPWKPLSSDS